MEANVQYNDLRGSAAADITDAAESHTLEALGALIGIDTNRFEPIGISIYGVYDHSISLICIDKQKSTEAKEHIVKIGLPPEVKLFHQIFKRLQVVLYSKFDSKYPSLDVDEEIRLSPDDEEE